MRVRRKFGHYEPSSGKPSGAQSTSFALWSQARESLVPRRLWFLALFAALNLGVIVFKRRRIDRSQYDRGVTALHAWLLLTGALAFVTVTGMSLGYIGHDVGLEVPGEVDVSEVGVGLIAAGHEVCP